MLGKVAIRHKGAMNIIGPYHTVTAASAYLKFFIDRTIWPVLTVAAWTRSPS